MEVFFPGVPTHKTGGRWIGPSKWFLGCRVCSKKNAKDKIISFASIFETDELLQFYSSVNSNAITEFFQKVGTYTILVAGS